MNDKTKRINDKTKRINDKTKRIGDKYLMPSRIYIENKEELFSFFPKFPENR